MIRSVLAVLAGIAALTVTSFAIEAAANALMMRMFPHALPNRAAISQSLPASLFLFGYTALCVACGGYVTAWIVKRSPVRHALIMGVLQVALTVWAMLCLLPKEEPLGTWLAAILLTVPCAWVGGRLRSNQTWRVQKPS